MRRSGSTRRIGDFGGLDIALIGVPMDLGVTNRPGARLGPRAVRQIERIGPYHHVHKSVPCSMVAIADVGDVPFASRYSARGEPRGYRGLFRESRGGWRCAGLRSAAIIRSRCRS